MATTALAPPVRDRRTCGSEAEHRLWEALRGRRLAGFRFRRRQLVAGAVPAFYCHEAKLAVDLDGPQPTPPWQLACDARARALAGVRVLRFRQDDVLASPEAVLAAIRAALPGASPPVPLPPVSADALAPLAALARGDDALTSLLAALAAAQATRPDG
jgi:very-short-patch-repair endonuclease